jgi:hypothetical protein
MTTLTGLKGSTRHKQPVLLVTGQACSGKTTFIKKFLAADDDQYHNVEHNHLSQSNSQMIDEKAFTIKAKLDDDEEFRIMETMGISDVEFSMKYLIKALEKQGYKPTLVLIFIRAGRMETQVQRAIESHLKYFKHSPDNTIVVLTHFKEVDGKSIDQHLDERLQDRADCITDREVLTDMGLDGHRVLGVDFMNQESVDKFVVQFKELLREHWNDNPVQYDQGCSVS